MPNVAELLQAHVALTVDCVDRRYLHAYVPRLQSAGGVVGFLAQRGHEIPSPALWRRITEGFKTALPTWCQEQGIPWLEFPTGARKDDVVEPSRRRFLAGGASAGVVLVGVAQERNRGWRATKRVRGREVHFDYVRTTVYVNHDDVYVLDREGAPPS